MRAVMPYFATVGVLLLAGRSTLAAQAPRTTAEIGTSVGVTILSQSGFNTQTHIGVPGGVGPISVFSPMLYASFFASPSLMVEPQVSFSSTSSGGTTDTFFWFAGQVAYLFTPHQTGSPYLAVNGAFQTASETGNVCQRAWFRRSCRVQVQGQVEPGDPSGWSVSPVVLGFRGPE